MEQENSGVDRTVVVVALILLVVVALILLVALLVLFCGLDNPKKNKTGTLCMVRTVRGKCIREMEWIQDPSYKKLS